MPQLVKDPPDFSPRSPVMAAVIIPMMNNHVPRIINQTNSVAAHEGKAIIESKEENAISIIPLILPPE